MHGPGEADANVYAYVSGQTLKATDPLGLQEAKVEQVTGGSQSVGVTEIHGYDQNGDFAGESTQYPIGTAAFSDIPTARFPDAGASAGGSGTGRVGATTGAANGTTSAGSVQGTAGVGVGGTENGVRSHRGQGWSWLDDVETALNILLQQAPSSNKETRDKTSSMGGGIRS